jgi:hypothetical protein
LSVDFCNEGPDGAYQDCVADAYFGRSGEGEFFYDRRLSEGVAVEVPLHSDAANTLLSVAFQEGAAELIGDLLCDRIGACPGPLRLKGKPFCPAMDDDTFGTIIENVVADFER